MGQLGGWGYQPDLHQLAQKSEFQTPHPEDGPRESRWGTAPPWPSNHPPAPLPQVVTAAYQEGEPAVNPREQSRFVSELGLR